MRRCSALAALLLLALAAPANAQTGATARITSPSDGQLLSGMVAARAEGSAPAGLRSIKLMIEDRVVASEEFSNLRQDASVSYGWNTTEGLSGGIARNGWYQIKVEVAASGGATDRSFINVRVDNGTQTPSAFTSSVKQQTISLSWAPNPEPDITGYRLEVSTGDSWTTVTETSGTHYAAELAPGTYQYRVTAFRSSPTMSGGRPSSPTEPLSITVEAPAPGEMDEVDGGGGPVGGGATGSADRKLYGREGRGTARDVAGTARRFASGGISMGGLSLPGQVGLPELPGTAPMEWGTYKERLPYTIPQGGIPLESVPARLAAISTTTIIPSDALRWVATGALMIVLAGLMQLLSMLSTRAEKLAAAGVADATKLLPAVSFGDAIVRIRRVQDRVRTAWQEARGR